MPVELTKSAAKAKKEMDRIKTLPKAAQKGATDALRRKRRRRNILEAARMGIGVKKR